jgi:translation initiation factor IF-3
MAQQRGRPRGPVRTTEVRPPMNELIQYESLRVTMTPESVDKSSNKPVKDIILGIMTKSQAIAKAKEMGNLDLILINENSDPPVAKIADYSKFRYEKEKKAKELKKNSKASELKEIKMSYKIDSHDYDVRKKNAAKFISQGNRVKCTIMFKGREVQHDALGVELLQKLAEDLTKISTTEGKPKREGRSLAMILTPRAEVTKAVNDKKRAEEKAKKKSKQEKLKSAASGATGSGAAAAVTVGNAVVDVDGLFDLDDDDDVDLLGSDDDDDDDDDEDEDDDDDDDDSLDALLGQDDLTDSLFSS